MSDLSDYLRAGYKVSQTTRIVPARPKASRPQRLSDTQRQVADRFYHNATPLAKFIYLKITERYENLPKEAAYLKRKTALMEEAKGILNEHRNKIVEVVMPMFDVRPRLIGLGNAYEDGQPLTEADSHAHDYFVRNVFAMLYRTYEAWLPEFVTAEQMGSCEETLRRLYGVHQERLESELRNWEFGFRKISAPR